MYQKPDFVKVSVKVKDVFANYIQTGCPMDEGAYHALVGDNCYEYSVDYTTFVAETWSYACYSTLRP